MCITMVDLSTVQNDVQKICYPKDLLLERSVARTGLKPIYLKERAQLHEGSLTRKWEKCLELKYLF